MVLPRHRMSFVLILAQAALAAVEAEEVAKQDDE